MSRLLVVGLVAAMIGLVGSVGSVGSDGPVGSAPPPQRPGDVVTYAPPVEAPVVRSFDMSAGPYGAGSRGLDYAARPGEPVHAIGDGIVVFAGEVAGSRWVTIVHPDGLRSSYGPLVAITASAGAALRRGSTVGTAGDVVHLGVRDGTGYIDPASLFTRRPRHAHLIGHRRTGAGTPTDRALRRYA